MSIGSQQAAPRTSQVVAAVIGNALEWYDFIVFGFLAVVISRLFFPSDSEYSSLLMATATFGVGFFMRPVGGVLLGIYADRRGRKAALQLIIGMMTAVMAEQFPAGVRSTGLALAYNVAVMVFGGFAQFIVTWLIHTTGVAIAPVFYVMFASALGFVAALFLTDRTHVAHLAAVDEGATEIPPQLKAGTTLTPRVAARSA